MKRRTLSTSLLLIGSSFFAASVGAAEFSDQAQVTSVRAVFGSAPAEPGRLLQGLLRSVRIRSVRASSRALPRRAGGMAKTRIGQQKDRSVDWHLTE